MIESIGPFNSAETAPGADACKVDSLRGQDRLPLLERSRKRLEASPNADHPGISLCLEHHLSERRCVPARAPSAEGDSEFFVAY